MTERRHGNRAASPSVPYVVMRSTRRPRCCRSGRGGKARSAIREMSNVCPSNSTASIENRRPAGGAATDALAKRPAWHGAYSASSGLGLTCARKRSGACRRNGAKQLVKWPRGRRRGQRQSARICRNRLASHGVMAPVSGHHGGVIAGCACRMVTNKGLIEASASEAAKALASSWGGAKMGWAQADIARRHRPGSPAVMARRHRETQRPKSSMRLYFGRNRHTTS